MKKIATAALINWLTSLRIPVELLVQKSWNITSLIWTCRNRRVQSPGTAKKQVALFPYSEFVSHQVQYTDPFPSNSKTNEQTNSLGCWQICSCSHPGHLESRSRSLWNINILLKFASQIGPSSRKLVRWCNGFVAFVLCPVAPC
jgi:hypothetical protein